MKNLTNKNKIYVALFVLVLVFSFASPSYARTVTMNTGASFTGNSDDNNNSNDDSDNIVRNPSPYVTSLSPSSATTGTGAKTITVYGNNFVSNSKVRYNGNTRPTTYVSSTRLLVNLSETDMTGLGDNYISVLNPAPGGGVSNTATFTLNKADIIKTTTTKATTVSKASTTKKTVAKKEPTKQVACTTGSTLETDGTLSAGAIYGSSNFLPSNIVQWIFFLILLFLAIILIRKLFFNQKKTEARAYAHA